MADQNDHTGARLVTKATTPAYAENYDKIFGKKLIKKGKEEALKNSQELKDSPAIIGGEQD